MELFGNINRLLGDDLKRPLKPGARLKVAGSCVSIYAFEALKAELEPVDELHFTSTSPTRRGEPHTDFARTVRRFESAGKRSLSRQGNRPGEQN